MALLQMIDNSALVDMEEAEIAAAQEAASSDTLISSLAGEIQRQWSINRDHKKQHVEPILLQCMRQRNGVYSPRELAEIREQGGSEVYMLLTAAKIRACASWISDLLLPAADKAWGLEPTPIPDLPPHVKQQTIELLTAEVTDAQQRGVNPDSQQIEERTLEFKRRMLSALQKEADDACASMETKIEDQLAESGFADALELFIDDFSTFPTAFLKGPVYQHKKGLQWGPGGQPIVVDEVVETDVRVSPFDIYPSPGATCIDEGNLVEVARYTTGTLAGLRSVPQYDARAIEQVLEDYSGGYLGDWTARNTDGRADLELRDEDDDDLIEALHYWGSVSGRVLQEWGMDPAEVPDPFEQYSIEAILIGRHVIKVCLNADPLDRRPYYAGSFQNNPGSIWGIAPPMLMEDIQRVCNATARSLMNNMGLASGPMAWVNTDMLPQGEVVTGFHPLKIFQVNSKQATAGGDPIRFFQPASNAAELLTVYNTFEQKADDATNIPRYMYGNEKVAGAGQTAQGLAMLLESASKGVKSAIRHIDMGVIRPRVERQYHHNMLYVDDPTIKGDLKVVARGSSELIAKAASQARRNEFMAVTNNATDAQIIGLEGRAELLRKIAKDMDLPGVIPEPEELAAKAQQSAQNQQQGDQADQMRLQIEQMRIQWEQQKLQLMLEDNERERTIKDRLAQYGLQGDMMELAGRKELTLEQIKAKLGEVAMREENANRRFLAEKEIKAQYGSGL